MAPGVALQSNFTSGELSPSLTARVDLAKYGQGMRTMRNFFVQAHGPAVKRPGFMLLDELPGPCVLVGFAFNNDQTYALALGEKWMRVARHDGFVAAADGGVYEIESPYTLEQARQLSYIQSADVLFMACQNVPPQRLMRFAHNDWRFEAMSFDPPMPAPEGLTAAFVNEAKDSAGKTSAAQLVTPYTYYVTAVNAAGKESGVSAGAELTGPSPNNWQSGDYIALAWQAVEGAEEYRVYKAEFGGRAGYVATTGETSCRDFNVSATLSEGVPKYVNPFVLKNEDGEEIEDYPGAVGLFQQRLVFASTPRRPQSLWLSKSGDYENFALYTPITEDSPLLEMTPASREVSSVNWMESLRSLILGTSGVEWEISGSGGNPFTAKNAQANAQSYWGSSLKKAVVAGNVILHVASSGSQVRNLQYDFGSDSYGGVDLSIMAAHLFDQYKIIDWTYQKNPDSIVWAVRSDGVLLGLTFQSEHQVSAWHRHDTDGRFEAVCAVPHGYEYSLFAVIEREGKRYLERMADRYLGGDPSRAVFLDCALTYEGPEVQTLTGLEHLEGKEVGILSKGAVEAPRVVQGGKVTLDSPSTLATVGLLYTADLETMPVEIVAQDGSSVALKKQISTVNISFRESLGVKAGLSTEPGNLDRVKWQDVKWRTNEPYGSPPEPYSGVKHVTMPVLASNILTICLRSELPTPVTVLSLVSRIEVKA